MTSKYFFGISHVIVIDQTIAIHLLELSESECKPSLNDEQVNRNCAIHVHSAWLKGSHRFMDMSQHYNDASFVCSSMN